MELLYFLGAIIGGLGFSFSFRLFLKTSGLDLYYLFWALVFSFFTGFCSFLFLRALIEMMVS